MSSAERHARRLELLARVKRTTRLGDPVPAVSPEVADVLVELLLEYANLVDELDELEAKS